MASGGSTRLHSHMDIGCRYKLVTVFWFGLVSQLGVPFHFRCAKKCALTYHKKFSIGSKNKRDLGIGVPKSRTATTCGNISPHVPRQLLPLLPTHDVTDIIFQNNILHLNIIFSSIGSWSSAGTSSSKLETCLFSSYPWEGLYLLVPS